MCAQTAINDHGSFRLVLSGGSTPQALYHLLASPEYARRIPWEQTHVFWGDERCVPLDHPDSNYRLAYDTLLSHIPLPADHIHRIPAEKEPMEAAAQYETHLLAHLRAGIPGHLRLFDLTLLGLGSDGHSASLFPHTPALQETGRLAVANFVPSHNQWRVTLTAPAINFLSDRIVFLVSGASKAAALNRVLYGSRDPAALPAQMIQPISRRLLWLVDAQAASELASPPLAGS